MNRQDRIGSFELLVMLAVLQLGDQAYGVMISREIEKRLKGRRVSVGSVYAALERLEAKDWVISDLGEATPVRGGKAKTYFRLSAKGVREVRSTHGAIASFWNSIPEFSKKST